MIEILLTTYQSEMYLEDQINSLLNQSYKDWKLLIRDDGSSDDTLQILEKYQKSCPDKIKNIIKSKKNVGVIKSFEYLLDICDAEYVMFCDHDDIWLPDKIKYSISKMVELENENPHLPILVHTDLTVVNSKTEIIESSFWKYSKLNPYLLSKFNYLGVCNGITGCTILINKKAKEICLPISINALMHDSWIALRISKYGKIGYVNQSTILYRQHEFNQIGAKEINNCFQYIQSRLTNLNHLIVKNKLQWKLLCELEYGSFLKYIYFKLSYFLKVRI